MPLEQARLLVDHRSAAGPVVTHVRGALIVSSLETLRELELLPRYRLVLAPELADTVLLSIASSWIPCDAAMAHYAACDAMSLSQDELTVVGARVASRIMGTYLGTLMRNLRPPGTSAALVALPSYHKVWDRLLQGGSCRVRLSGPKDAIIDSSGLPMFRYRYFRLGYLSLLRGAGLMLTKACYTRQLKCDDMQMSVSASWV